MAKKVNLDKKLKYDSSLVRGLEYYTGLVFEICAGKELSCGGGGRYDNLIKIIGGPDLPATGISFGLDRIVALMDDKKLFKFKSKNIFLISLVDKSKTIKLVDDLRKKEIIIEYDIMDRKFSKQLDYCNKKKIPYVLILGEKELKQKSIKLKNMETGKEKTIKLNELSKQLKKL